jgi:eukaryotic-like serine/threonine-protein kinase
VIHGLIVGFIVSLIISLIIGLMMPSIVGEGPATWERFGLDLLTGGLNMGLIFGLFSGLIGGFTNTAKVGKASPNQGIKLSGKNSLAVFLTTSLTVVPLVYGIATGPTRALPTASLTVAAFWALSFGLIVGLSRGGSAVIKHYALRLILSLSGYTPFNFVNFLDQCARLILLKKVGGGYIFIHRMLLDYFAEMTPQSTKAEDGTTGPVGP